MIDIVQVMKRSLASLWQRKALWIFGFFLQGANGDGGGNGGPVPPIWVIVLIIAVVLGILIMHLISEGAVIEGVASSEPIGIREGFRRGLCHFGVMLRIKSLVLGGVLVALGVLTAPAWLYFLDSLSKETASLLGVLAIAIGVPIFTVAYVVYVFALRIAILENCQALDALQAARQFVRGRIRTGLKLIGAEAVSFLALVLAVIVVLAPVGLLAGTAFLRFSGWPAAAVVGVVIALPALLATVGAHGTYRSALWTHGYLAARSA